MHTRMVATHLLRQHRQLRRRLPALDRLATPDGEEAARSAARRAAAFLDREVLDHADLEDALVAYVPAAGMDTGRLLPYHDSLREASSRLREHADDARPSLAVPGLVGAVRDLLGVHLEDEWHTLVPLLGHLDEGRATTLAELLPDGPSGAGDRELHARLPVPYDHVAAALSVPSPALARALAAAAEGAVSRAARDEAVVCRPHVELVPAIAGPELLVLAGRLGLAGLWVPSSVLEFDAFLAPRRDGVTALTVHHTPPADPPRHPHDRLAATAVAALAGALAAIAAGRRLPVTTTEPDPTGG